MSSPRKLVRVLVGLTLSLALTACTVLPLPEDLPAIALGQASVYRLEVALAVFYGFLLLLTPAYAGLAAGQLPTEISTRGAKFGVEATQTAEQDEAAIKDLEQGFASLGAELAEARNAINRLETGRVTRSDWK